MCQEYREKNLFCCSKENFFETISRFFILQFFLPSYLRVWERFVYFRSFISDKYCNYSTLKIDLIKASMVCSVGIQSHARTMAGADGSTRLPRPIA